MWVADKLVYQNESDFIRAYKGSEMVWELPSGLYYISWSPSNLSGSFTLFGQTYNMQDYMGYYDWKGSGVITSYAFQSTGIETISTNVSIIQKSAFANCSSLSMATLPECNTIYNNAFYGCSNLEMVYLPKVTSISSLAFGSTYTNLVLEGSSVCSFYGNIFSTNTSGITNHFIYVPSSLVSSYIAAYPSYYHPSAAQGVFPSYPMFGSLYYMKWTPYVSDSGTFSLMWNSETYTFNLSYYNYENYFVSPFRVNGIMDELVITSSAFKNKSMIETFETNAMIIQESAFYGCSKLKTVTLTDCKTIGLYAFASCSSMESLILGNSSICHLFGNSTALYNNNTKIYVPASLVNDYKNDVLWSYYKYRIYSIR